MDANQTCLHSCIEDHKRFNTKVTRSTFTSKSCESFCAFNQNLIFWPEMNPKSTHVEQKQGCKWQLNMVVTLNHHSRFYVCVSGDVTMVICPGIGNHSENKYIRTFVDHSQRQGYRCAVLNHLGALPNLELTAPRLFTYGNIGNRPSHTQ